MTARHNTDLPFSRTRANCFVSVPFNRLVKDLRKIIDNRIQPEIGLEGDVLYTVAANEFRETAGVLSAAGLACTFHAPFFDLLPGARDQNILKASREKLRRAFALIPVFKPRSIVCHLDYEAKRHDEVMDSWFSNSMATWQELLAVAEQHGTFLMLENTFESDPAMHRRIFEALASPSARFCLDVGHLVVFARTGWLQWLPALAPWLGQLHLHDNHGDFDSHLAIGAGRFDFKGLFAYLQANSLRPLLTIEAHQEEAVLDSLGALERLTFSENA